MADIAGNHLKVLLKEYASGNYIEDVSPDVVQVAWTFKMQGGIEAFEVVLARDSAGLSGLTHPIVEIWCQDADSSWVMVAAGQCLHENPLCAPGRVPTLTLICAGYLQQLHHAYFDHDYSSTTLDAVVEDIIDTQVAADVDITRWAAKTTAGSATVVNSFKFDGTAYGAIAHCAEMQGGVEWGVMPQLIGGTWYPAKFYFVASSATVNNHFFATDMWNIEYDYDYSRIRNDFVLRGDFQANDGDTLDTTESDSTSQTNYGKRTEIIDNAFIDDADDAGIYLEAVEAALKDPGRGLGFSVSGKGVSDRMERNAPMGVSHIWNLFTDADAQDWHCNSLVYVAKPDGSLDMYLNFGDKLGVRQIYQTPQRTGGYMPGRNWLPVYGRGGYNPLNPNHHDVDWGRPVGTGRKQRFHTKEFWKTGAGKALAEKLGY